MTKRILDFNPLTGEKVLFEYEQSTDKMVITHQQDVSPALEYSQTRAKDDGYTKKGIKNDMWHYARVPNAVIMEMKSKHGVDFFDQNHQKRVFELINKEYPYCKTTHGTHNLR
jgi:hypothetical protein